MSEENVQVFKRGVEALNTRDIDGFLEAFDPQAEWRPVFEVMLGGEATVYRGHGGIREALEELYDVFPEIDAEHWEFRDHGDQLVAIGRLRARGEHSGVGNESPLVCVAEFKDGKVLRLRDYLGLDAALEASGLAGVRRDNARAMSAANVEVIRAGYEAWNAGDTVGFQDFFADDVEFRPAGLFPGFDAVYRGRDGILRFYEEMISAWDFFRIEMRDAEDRGDWVIVALQFLGKGKSSGVEVELDFFHAARVVNGQCTYLVSATSADQALEAAGLSS